MLSLREESVARLLRGKEVEIAVAEPFDFEGPDGEENALRGRIVEARAADVEGGREIEIEVAPFASPKGVEVGRLVARARYDDGKDVVEELADGRDPSVNLFYPTDDGAGFAGHLIGGVRLA